MKEFSHPGSKDKVALDLNKAIKTAATISTSEWKPYTEEVVLNIIINGAHAIQQKGQINPGEKGIITIQTRMEDNGAVLRIGDNDAGIPQELLKNL